VARRIGSGRESRRVAAVEADQYLLAGDVGGTKTDLAIFARRGDRLTPVRQEEYASREHASLEAMLRRFLDDATPSRIGAACFAVAGPTAEGKAHTTNLPWTVDAAVLGRLVGTDRVKLVNDLQAAAYGMLFLEPGDFRVLHATDPRRQGNIAVIAPGTGLGEAILFRDGARYHAIASEGGHADFAPRTDREIDLLRFLRARCGGHVSYERVLSGDGLHSVYAFLRDAGQAPEPPWLAERLARGDPNAAIAELALTGESALCTEALDLFCSVLGAEAGNLALRSFATGGVILGGGIPPKILPALEKGGFMAALTDKGRLTPWLKEGPVSVALVPRAALIGAAQLLLAGPGEPGS
jgi:glucokinase